MQEPNVPINKKQRSSNKTNPIIIAALIGLAGVIIAALLNPDLIVLMRSTDTPKATLAVGSTSTVLSPSPTSTITHNPISTLAQECQNIEVYLELDNLLTGIKQVGCSSDDRRIVNLSNKDIGELANLTGRITGSAFAKGNVCDWQWFTNTNTFPQRLNDNCSFSIDLNINNLENISIENADGSILFTIQIPK
jgi:hypothetical protein